MTKNVTRWHSLTEAREGLRELWKFGETIGSIHTLGALHEGHGNVIKMAARENDNVVISIYPNIAQLPPGSVYEFDIDRDCEEAARYGATHIITPSTEEMYPDEYRTFFDQGEQYQRLDGEVNPTLFRGMITMSTRWISFTRPTNTYWGLKDIGQVILVKRAVDDLLIDTNVREVPCVRYKSGMAISSRMMNKPESVIKEFNIAYKALEEGRKAMANGETNTDVLIDIMREKVNEKPLKHFQLSYVKVAKPQDFIETEKADIPVIMQIVMSLGDRQWFEGFYLRNEDELQNGPETIWLDEEYPEFAK